MGDEKEKGIRLLGLCLGPVDNQKAARIVSAAAELESWDSFLDLCRDRLATPHVYASLKKARAIDHISSDGQDRLKRSYLTNAAMNSLKLRQAMGLSEALEEAGFETLFIKGSSLVMGGHYPDPGYRPFSDVDLLVRGGSQEKLEQIVTAMDGWKTMPPQQMLEWETTPCMDKYGTHVDVHWRLKPFAGVSGDVPWERIWGGSGCVAYKGREVRVPSPEDSYIHTAIHATAHHAFDSGIIFIAVADMNWLAVCENGLDWKKMASGLINEKLLAHAAVATLVAYNLTGEEKMKAGLDIFFEQAPEVRDICLPFTDAFMRMLYKPHVFRSMLEGQMFAKESRAVGFMFFARWVRRQIRNALRQNNGYSGVEEHEIQNLFISPAYRKRIWDPDYMKYVFELYRFYKRLGFVTLE